MFVKIACVSRCTELRHYPDSKVHGSIWGPPGSPWTFLSGKPYIEWYFLPFTSHCSLIVWVCPTFTVANTMILGRHSIICHGRRITGSLVLFPAAQPYPCLYWHNIVGLCYYKANILQIPHNKQHSMLVVAKSLVRLTSGPAFCLLLGSKLRLCSANHRAGCFSNLVCDWLSIVWAYSDQETENRPWSMHYMLTTMVVCQISCHMWLGDMNVSCTDISEMKNFVFWYMSQCGLLAWNTYRYKNSIKSRCYKYPCVMKAEAGRMQSGWPNLICP